MKVGTAELYMTSDQGKIVDEKEYLSILNSYSRIIIWGAGNLGEVVGAELKRRGITVEAYWDARYDHMTECNDLPVEAPMQNMGNLQDTLIVFCITNAFVVPKLIREMEESNIFYLQGIYLYQAFLCPVSVENPDIQACYSRKECNVATCKRMNQIMYEVNAKKDRLFMNTLDVYLTQICSLGCKYCYIYTNSYPKEKRIHFDTQRILDDVDIICEAASFIKRMVPFGGEPFLHPDLAVIIERMASKKNVGVIDLISNGIFHQPDEVLERLKFPNVKINVSNYNTAIPERLVKIREKNIERLLDIGLNVIVHTETPQWRKPGDLRANGLGAKELKAKKNSCGNFLVASGEDRTPESLIVKNGRFFACQHCDTVYQLGLCGTQNDSVALSKDKPTNLLVKEMKELIHRPYYEACGFCNPSIELVDCAGEQGVDERYLV